jgi:Icc-related predicted phosphoesterase
VRITSISDTHCFHRKIEKIPEADVFIHAGDITKLGEIAVLDDFAHWVKDLPHEHKIVIAGNHDFSLEIDNHQKSELLKLFKECGITYLQDSGVEIDGVYFYGSPATPIHNSKWAFNLERDSKDLANIWDAIPNHTNVLITHGPPFEILDEVPRGVRIENTGCKMLADTIWEMPKLKAHIFGHIHEGYGTLEEYGIKFLNSCICNAKYKPENLPHVFDL